ncbi:MULTISPECIES: ElyC/SanA/YdcF family protein [unclassified Micromonospora]|uniref:SanA/YdcF family protein n=1 Tax=unclassified Micromonospora TaxID=2617518 RepID=UPI001C23B828|nr:MULTISPECIES: ElyC/SanA/YdcF family protein [unclassified Micromonospora]MBU8856967.1 YdcF family protein [Micromonospora sp. WMMB482]MDM4782585.1 ElyC/SanA/YdcF family protein [Micromonospora sp. b486]
MRGLRARWRAWGDRRRAVRLLRRLLVLATVAVMLLGTATVASVSWVRAAAEGRLFDAADAPETPVALVLGTKVEPDGTPASFLAGRLEIARRLYAAGKVQVLLLSGDNMDRDYDEPGAMRRWLVDRGVPAEKTVLDHAGFDTYDSCVRAHRVFGVRRATVVTQSFHLPRAVALCRDAGIDAVGVGDDTARRHAGQSRISSTREYGACVKAAVDVLTGRDPVHLGRRETGVDDALRA